MVGCIFNLRVIPNSSCFKICSVDEKFGTIKVKVRSPPAKGKANDEIEKEFGKIFGSGARIISGYGRREKRLLLGSIEKTAALDILKQLLK